MDSVLLPNPELLWDKTLGDYTLVDSPHCSSIRLLEDNRLELRGHIVPKVAEESSDPEYYFWKAWLNSKGDLTQEIGEIINWSDPSWQKFIEVEK